MCRDINGDSKPNKFLKSTKTNSPTPQTGATILPPTGNAFMFVETSSNTNGNHTYVIWERTDIIQITNITFYYNSFWILTDDSLKRMGRLRIDVKLDDNTWSNQYTIAENSQYSDSSTDWSLINLDITVENYGIRLVYDRIQSAHADMCFSNITITHSVY